MEEIMQGERIKKDNSYLVAGEKKVALRLIRSVIIGVAILVLGMGIGYQYREYVGGIQDRIGKSASVTPTASLNKEDIDFTLFWEVWDTLQHTYIEPNDLDPEQMVYGAIQGMTASVGDPYTVFLPPSDNQRAKEDLNGAFDGVGIQLGYKRDTLAVMTPLDDHPAIRKGVKAGDLIINIKDEEKEIDEDTVGMSLQEAVTLIRGKKGTSVTLTLYREDKGTFDVEIVRDTIVIPSVEAELGRWTESGWEETADGNVVLIKVRRFGERTLEQWDDAVNKVIHSGDQVDGVVLDLRNNPGGFLKSAIDLASDFVPEGLVVEQQGRLESHKFEVTRRGRLLGVPVVVLINGGSASASEILAGALRDRLNVVLVGEKSFGKGTVQEAADLKKNAGLHVTTSRWLLPSGDWIHEAGIEPDIVVELPEVDEASDSAEFIDTQLRRAIEEVGQ